MEEEAQVRDQVIDNRWVVPYNPRLLNIFNCHVNVEICSTLVAYMYLYKYVYKGHTMIQSEIANSNDEILRYLNSRYVGVSVACWRLFGFEVSVNKPAVYQLQVHLSDQQFISFSAESTLLDIQNQERLIKTQLIEWFEFNKTASPENICHTLKYHDFPHYFTWNIKDRKWTQRKSRSETIGRMVFVQPSDKERYFLRLLLCNVKGATSFEDLRTIKKATSPKFCLLNFSRRL